MSKPNNLFEFEEEEPLWKREWRNMPDFHQDDLEPYRQIRINFANEEDLMRFGELIGQPITLKTKSVRYPERIIVHTAHLEWKSDL
jgi:hypothetical protein